MITKARIVEISKKEKLPLGTVEKDFVLTYLLKKIYESKLKNKLVFKGGTALHKFYLHRRISIDLDFTELEKININDLKKTIEDKEINSKIKEIIKTNNSTKIILSYFSILEYKNNIVLDISKREKPILKLVIKKLKSPYFKEINILTFQLEELVAEKIRALVQRNKPRDYLDVYYALKYKNINCKKAINIAKKKLEITKDKFSIKNITNKDNLALVKSLWEQDLRELLPDIPDFNKVVITLEDKLKIKNETKRGKRKERKPNKKSCQE